MKTKTVISCSCGCESVYYQYEDVIVEKSRFLFENMENRDEDKSSKSQNRKS